MFDKIKLCIDSYSAVGFAYDINFDGKSGKNLLQIYIVCFKNGAYDFVPYKKVKSVSFKYLYDVIDEMYAKPVDYYTGQDFGRQYKKI